MAPRPFLDPRHVILRCATNSYRDKDLRCHTIPYQQLYRMIRQVKPFCDNPKWLIANTLDLMRREGYVWISDKKPRMVKFDMHNPRISSHIMFIGNQAKFFEEPIPAQ